MFSSRLSTASLCSAVALSLFVGACGSAKPAEANAPRSEVGAVAATSAPSQQSTPRSEPIPVHVADDIRQACGVTDQDAYFAFDSAQLDSPDVRTLTKVATCFTVGPLKGRRVKVIGHADPRGPEDYNMSLALSRADSVAGYLRTKGLERAKEWTTSRGAMDATGRDEPGWRKDRRVDLMLGE